MNFSIRFLLFAILLIASRGQLISPTGLEDNGQDPSPVLPAFLAHATFGSTNNPNESTPDEGGPNSPAEPEPEPEPEIEILLEPDETELNALREQSPEPEVLALSDWDQGPTLPNLADSNGWSDPEYYSTFQVQTLYDVIWLFARGLDGVEVFNYNHTTKSWNTFPTLDDLADSNNWGSDPKYYSTIQVVILGNDFWLLARDKDGVVLYQYDPLPNTWAQKQGNSRFSDDNGWDQPEYYSTMQAFGASGRIWLFVRGPSGEEIHTYDLDTDSWDALPVLSALSDANKWGSNPRYYSTMQVVFFENSYWLIARGVSGIELYQYNPNSGNWAERQGILDFTDAVWRDPEYYSTIQSVALGESIWLFGRGEFGVVVYQYDPNDNAWEQKQSLPALSDSNGWDQEQYYSTIQVVTLDDSIALLARGPDGLQYYDYFPNTDSWSGRSTLTNLSDANNWDSPEYYSTIKGINYDGKVTVLARGDSGMEVYVNDE